MAMNMSHTREWRRVAGGLLLLFAGLALSGCTVAHMKLPQGMKSEATALEVEGLRSWFITGEMRFGPYQVTDIHRGWTKGSGWSVAGFSQSKSKQKFEFAVSDPVRGKWRAQCVSGAKWKKQNLGKFLGGNASLEFSTTQQLICVLKQEGGAREARIFMSRSLRAGQDFLSGVMVDGNTRIAVSGTNKLDATPLPVSDPTGYILRIGDRPVGAVEIINKGTVWLSNSATPETRSVLAATAVVMLMYQDVKKVSERN